MMKALNEVMTAFLNECKEKGFKVSGGKDTEVFVSNDTEEVELNLTFEGDKRLSINFYRVGDTSDNFVNALMRLFADIVNNEKIGIIN